MFSGKSLKWSLIMAMIVIGALVGQAQAADTIKIGFMANMSTAPCKSSLAAAKMAVDEINAVGGINGKKVELISEDTTGQIPKAVEIYKKLVMNDHVVAVIVAEKVEMAVAGMEIGAELYPEYPHLMFSTIGSGDSIWHKVRDNYDKYGFAFQTYYSTSTNYLKIWAPIFKEIYGGLFKAKKIALIYEDMEWTKPLRKGIEGVSPRLADVYENLGMEVVYESTVSVDQKMFTSIFEEAAASGAQVIDCAIGYINEGAFVKQWAQSSAQDLPITIWGGLAGMPPFWKISGGQCLGVMVGSSMVAVPISPKTIPFMTNLYTKYKTGAIFGSHTTYDTIYGFKKAVETAGPKADVPAIIKAVEGIEEVAVLGTIGWDAKLHYNLPYPKYMTPVVQWQKDGKGGGAMKVIFPENLAQAPAKTPAELRK